jgi:hypothetical protein
MLAVEPRSCLRRYLPTQIGPSISRRRRVAFLAIDHLRAHAGADLVLAPSAWRPRISLA